MTRADTGTAAATTVTPPDQIKIPRQTLTPVGPRFVAPPAVSWLPVSNPLAGRHVAVVGMHYSPLAMGIGPYSSAIAEHLAGQAGMVSVLTGSATASPVAPEPVRPPMDRSVAGGVLPTGPTVLRHAHVGGNHRGRLARWAYETSFAASVSRTTLTQAPDVVLAITPSVGSAMAGARLARRANCPLVLMVHDMVRFTSRVEFDEATQASVARAPRGVLARWEAAAMRAADRVVLSSEGLYGAAVMAGVPEPRLDVIGLWSPLAEQAPTREQARAALGWGDREFVAVYTGPLSGMEAHRSDASTMLAAAAQVGTASGVRFVFGGQQDATGPGPSRRTRRAVAAVPNAELACGQDQATLIAAADVLLASEECSMPGGWLPATWTAYRDSGLPIVAAVSPLGVMGRELASCPQARLVASGYAEAIVAEVTGLAAQASTRRVVMHRDGLSTQSSAGVGSAAGSASREPARREVLRSIETSVARAMAGL